MKTLTQLAILMVCIGLTACSPKFYSPNTQNVPLLSERGETNLTLSGNANQVEFQGAYALTSSLAVKANGGVFIPSDLDNGNGGRGKFVELGAGYFRPIQENWIFEAYGILGFGDFENHLPSTQGASPQTKGDISAGLLRIGVQPNFGYKSKYFSAAFSSRIVSLSYKNVAGDLIFEGQDQVAYLSDNSTNFLIEPALTLRGGVEKVKLQFQFGYSINVSNADFRQDKTYATLGLNFNFK